MLNFSSQNLQYHNFYDAENPNVTANKVSFLLAKTRSIFYENLIENSYTSLNKDRSNHIERSFLGSLIKIEQNLNFTKQKYIYRCLYLLSQTCKSSFTSVKLSR